MAVTRRIATLVLAIVAGLVGVLMLLGVIWPDQLFWTGETLIRMTAPNATIQPAPNESVTMSGWGRFLLFLLGSAHVACSLIAIWPSRSTSPSAGMVVMRQAEGAIVRVPYGVVQEYVLNVVRRLESVTNVRAKVLPGARGIRVRVRAAIDVSQQTVPEISTRIEQALRHEMAHTFGDVEVEDVNIMISKIVPSDTEGVTMEQRTIMSRGRIEESEPRATPLTESASENSRPVSDRSFSVHFPGSETAQEEQDAR